MLFIFEDGKPPQVAISHARMRALRRNAVGEVESVLGRFTVVPREEVV